MLVAPASAAAVPAEPPIEVFRNVTTSGGVREWVTVWSRISPHGCWSHRTRRTAGGRTIEHSSFVADLGTGPRRVSQTLEGGHLTEVVGTAPCDGDPPVIDAAVLMAAARRGAFRPVGTTRWRGRRVTIAAGPAEPFVSGWTAWPHSPRLVGDGPAVVLRSPGGPVRVRVPRAVLIDPRGRTVIPPRVIIVTRSVITAPGAPGFSFALRDPTR